MLYLRIIWVFFFVLPYFLKLSQALIIQMFENFKIIIIIFFMFDIKEKVIILNLKKYFHAYPTIIQLEYQFVENAIG